MSPHNPYKTAQKSQVYRVAPCRCSPTVFVFVIVYFLNKCLIITLIKCFKGDMSLGVLYSSVFNNVLGLSMTRLPIRADPLAKLWTAKCMYTVQSLVLDLHTTVVCKFKTKLVTIVYDSCSGKVYSTPAHSKNHLVMINSIQHWQPWGERKPGKIQEGWLEEWSSVNA